MSIDTKSSEFVALQPLFALSDALLGGTRAMRQAGETYLPKLGAEPKEEYEKRLSVSVLYPAYAETIKQMKGRVFFTSVERKDITIDESYLEDFNLNSDDIDAFLAEPFKHALAYSRAYVLVTAPSSEGIKTKADEKALNIRPYAVVINPSQVLGIKRERGEIVEFRYMTTGIITNEDYEEETKEKVIIHTAGNVRVYTKVKKDYQLTEQYEVKTGGKPYPVVPVAELIFEEGQLPLEHLAYLNVKHWQSQSDQDNILKYARVPMLVVRGADDDSQIQIGGSATMIPENADMQWLEHSGAAIGAGQESLTQLEAQMQSAGAKLLTRTKLSMTDSQAKEEQSKEISQLRYYANLLEDFAEKILYFFALFEGKNNGGRIEISGNIDADFDENQSMDRIDQGVRNGYVSPQTAFEELQRRAIVNSNASWEVEQVRLNAQGEVSE